MMTKEFDDVLLDVFLEEELQEEELQEEELQEEELQEEEYQEEEGQEHYNVYQLNSTVVQSTSSFFDTFLDDLPVLDICCLFFFSICVFFLFNLFNGGDNNVRFD